MNRVRNLGFLLRGVSRLSAKNFERHARGLDMSMSQCKVLTYLSRSEGISQTRLAEITETDPMTLVRTLDRMEQDGWVERRPDPGDRRAHCLYLREAAKPVLAQIWKISDIARDEALAGLAVADRERLIEVLEHIQQNLLALDGVERGPAGEKDARPAQRRKA